MIQIDIFEFEKETGLKLHRDYNSDNKYYETSGKSYSEIKQILTEYNKTHDKKIYYSNNEIKDVTEIYFH